MDGKNYILGLDLGIASVGWACVEASVKNDETGKEWAEPVGLLDCGVRVFEAAEVPKTGESLNAARRMARSQRKTIRRRAQRMKDVRKLLLKQGLLTEAEFRAAYSQNTSDATFFKKRHEHIIEKFSDGSDRLNRGNGYKNSSEQAFFQNVWRLRCKGLKYQLERAEFAAVILHLVKHRGYLSTRKSEQADAETGKMMKGIGQNSALLESGEYITPAQIAVYKFAQEGTGQIRNRQIPKRDKNGNIKFDKDGNIVKEGSYLHTFNRKDIDNELHILFSKQRELGNPYATETLYKEISGILMFQNPALQGDALLKMWGKDKTFEPEEYRAPKHSYTAERFVWISKLNNLRIKYNGRERELLPEERDILIEKPFEKSKLTFTQVRKLLNISNNEIFNLCRYKRDEEIEKSENSVFFEAKFFHSLKKVFNTNETLKEKWDVLKNEHYILDKIGEILSFYKEDKDRTYKLLQCDGYNFSEEEIDALLNLNFDKSINLSLKALYKILPLMELGKRYDEACREAYGDHYGRSKNGIKQSLLPEIDPDEIRNPVVLRTLTQARKIINAIIRRYGNPFRVHIETGRELGKSFSERKEIEKWQEENRAEWERAREEFLELFEFVPTGKDILLWRLYKQQDGKCLYSGKSIIDTLKDIRQIFEKGYVEIDHALPFSRTWDDSQNNKVLVLAGENQNKGNKTPFEWFGDNEEKWRAFEARVLNSHFSYVKKQRILTKELDSDGFISRNLNDTRYISRFLMNFIENNLKFSGKESYINKDGEECKYKKVLALNGQITSMLRNSWGFSKNREENDRHHALDAIVLACTTDAMQQKLTRWHQHRELPISHLSKEPFPKPWEWFEKEVMIRVFNSTEKINYDTKKNTCINNREDLIALLKSELPDRPEAVHDNVTPLFVSRKIRRGITGQAHLETVDKFMVENNGYLVWNKKTRTYKKSSGLEVRGGLAGNATMVRIDIFTSKNEKNYIVPVYAWQVAKGILPNMAIINGKPEQEWRKIDDSYSFRFSLYPYDIIELVDRKNPEKRVFGYYRGCDRDTGGLIIQEPDNDRIKIYKYRSNFGKNIKIDNNNDKKDKYVFYKGIGIQNMIISKYTVDILGKNIIQVPEPENRARFKNKFYEGDDE